MILESPQWGNKMLRPYIPQDSLENWMTQVTVPSFAREAPTHISQRGALYHIPSELIDEYLENWKASIETATSIPFFMEEVRGNPFRLYIDLDIPRTVHLPYDASQLISFIVSATVQIFPSCNPTVLSLECHGPVEDSDGSHFKSGYRLYFQHIFVDTRTYKAYVEKLVDALQHQNNGLSIPHMLPAHQSWSEICDCKSVDWDRGRLLGTIKRRKSLNRVYSFHAIFDAAGPNPTLNNVYNSDLKRILFGSTLRLWNSLPNDTSIIVHNNVYSHEKFLSLK